MMPVMSTYVQNDAILLKKFMVSLSFVYTKYVYTGVCMHVQSVLLKALPPVCMKYTTRGESRVVNIAQGKAECYICHKTLTKSCIVSYKQSGSALSVLLHVF